MFFPHELPLFSFLSTFYPTVGFKRLEKINHSPVQSSSTALAFYWLVPCARTCFFIDAQTTTMFYLKI
jgi:hypothetical protein